MLYLNHFFTTVILLILPTMLIILGFKFYVLNPSRKTECGLFSVLEETETINEFQTIITTKYSIHKWCYFKVVKHKTNNDRFN